MSMPIDARPRIQPMDWEGNEWRVEQRIESLTFLLENQFLDQPAAKRAWQALYKSCQSEAFHVENGLLSLGDGRNFFNISSAVAIAGLMEFISEFNKLNEAQILGIQFTWIYFSAEGSWQGLMRGVGSCGLEALHFIRCDLSACDIFCLVFQERHFPSQLRLLSIDDNRIRKEELAAIGEYAGNSSSLISLSLQNCCIDDEKLQHLLAGMKNNRSIQELNLSQNYIELKDVRLLCEWVKEKSCLQSLNLRDNLIGDQALILLAIAGDEKLVELHVGDNQELSDRGVQCALLWSRRLRVLDLQGCKNITSCSILGIALRSHHLQKLILGKTGISDQAVREHVDHPFPFRKESLDVIFFSGDGPERSTLLKLESRYASTNLNICLFKKEKKLPEQLGAADPMEQERSFASEVEKIYAGEPLFKEVQLAENANQELLGKIRDFQHSSDERRRIIKEACFAELLTKQFEILPISPDGNCFFASVAECISHERKSEAGGERCRGHLSHQELREKVVAYQRREMLHLADFLYDERGDTPEEKLEGHCDAMEKTNVWAGDFEVMAMVGVLREMEVCRPIWIFDKQGNNRVENGKICVPNEMIRGPDMTGKPILLYFSNENHYSAMFEKS